MKGMDNQPIINDHPFIFCLTPFKTIIFNQRHFLKALIKPFVEAS